MKIEHGVGIVTGSATGIGAATAVELARRGCNVVVNYTKSEDEAQETAAACRAAGADALAVQCDVSRDEDCRRMAQAAIDKWGRIDVLVNSAGTTKFADHYDLEALNAEDFQRIFAVNTIGPYQMVRACVPAMRKVGQGAIVNVSSLAGISAQGSSMAYAESKAALNNMTLSWARTLAPQIRVNAVCPGFVDTRWLKVGLGDKYQAVKDHYKEVARLARVASPEDVATAILFLIVGAPSTTGEFIKIDGGLHLPKDDRPRK